MEIKRGIPVSPGVAIGPALVLDTEGFRIPQRFVDGDQTPGRARAAAEPPCSRCRRSPREAADHQRQARQAIWRHLRRPCLAHGRSRARPRDRTLDPRAGHAAEYAVSRVIRRHAKALESLDRGSFMLRAADLFDIEKCILRNLLGQRRELLQPSEAAGRRPGPRSDAQRNGVAGSRARSRLRHRSRRPGQPHRHHGRRPRNPRRRRHRQIPHRRLRRRRGHRRRQPRHPHPQSR